MVPNNFFRDSYPIHSRCGRNICKNKHLLNFQECFCALLHLQRRQIFISRDDYLWLDSKKFGEPGKWQIHVKLKNQYDFTQFRNSLAFTDLFSDLWEIKYFPSEFLIHFPPKNGLLNFLFSLFVKTCTRRRIFYYN